MRRAPKLLLGALVALSVALGTGPVMVLASPIGGRVEYVRDTTNWYQDATSEFVKEDGTYWNDVVTSAPADYSKNDSSSTVSIGSAEALVWWAKQVNNGESFEDYTVSITGNLDLSAHYWTPICTGRYEKDNSGKWVVNDATVLEGATIQGNGHTITGLTTSTGLRGPDQDSKPGDGSNCFYDAAFIGYSSCDITIEQLTFDDARIAISAPFEDVVNTYGSSMLAVIVGCQSGGSLTLRNVTVNGADVLAMQKASAFVGNLLGNSTLTVEQCSITNSRFSAYFQVAPIAAYGKTTQVSVNGIKLENNLIRMVDQTWPEDYFQNQDSGAWYINEGSGYDLNASTTAVFYDGDSTIGSTPVNGTEWMPVAEVNGHQFGSLADAIEAARDGQTIELLKDVTETDLPHIAEAVTLDLNGKTLTTGKLVSEGDLTIVDSTATAGPTVSGDFETVGYESGKIKVSDAVYAAGGGTVTLESGTIESSYLGAYAQGDTTGASEIGSTFNIEGGYVCAQEFAATAQGRGATLNISGGVLVARDNAAVAGNGTKTATKDLGGTTINISGGTMIGHIITAGYIACGVYHPQQGVLNISGGTIYADGGVGVEMRGGTLNMTGGSVTATGTASGKVGDSKVALNCYGIQVDGDSNYYDYGNCRVTISGDARVSADEGVPSVIVTPDGDGEKISISGGYFTSDPSAYLGEDLMAVESGEEGYLFTVGERGDSSAKVVEAPAEVKLSNAIPEDAKGVAESVAAALGQSGTGAKPGIGEALGAAAGTVAQGNAVTVGSKTEGGQTVLEALQKVYPGFIGAEDVTIVIQPYLSIAVTGAEAAADGTATSVTLDITPMYRTVATTDPDHIILPGGASMPNAVQVGKERELDITKPVTVTIPLPTGFASDGTLYVEHKKDGRSYFYTGKVETNVLTFTNPHGFSEFTISATNGAAAELDGIGYGSLDDALADAGGGDIVKVLQSGLTATMSGQSREVTIENGTGEAITVTINGTELSIEANGTKPYSYTAPSGGGTAPAPTTHDVTVAAAENGKVSVDKTSASAGVKVTVTATPAEGYEVASVSVTCGEKQVDVTDNGDGTYAFSMPAGDVTVTVTFEASAPALPFTDVAEGSWYRGAVSFVYARGLMTGYEGTTLFGPEDALGREQAAAVLYRALGAGAQAPACGLADVSQADWYAHAVNWAVASGLVTGYDDGSGLFGVGDALTRDQFAAIVARVAKADLSKADPSALEAFSDGGEVAEWAVPAVSWAVQTGVLEGSDDGNGGMELRASAEITRGEMAAMIMRAAEAGLLPAA